MDRAVHDQFPMKKDGLTCSNPCEATVSFIAERVFDSSFTSLFGVAPGTCPVPHLDGAVHDQFHMTIDGFTSWNPFETIVPLIAAECFSDSSFISFCVNLCLLNHSPS